MWKKQLLVLRLTTLLIAVILLLEMPSMALESIVQETEKAAPTAPVTTQIIVKYKDGYTYDSIQESYTKKAKKPKKQKKLKKSDLHSIK